MFIEMQSYFTPTKLNINTKIIRNNIVHNEQKKIILIDPGMIQITEMMR